VNEEAPTHEYRSVVEQKKTEAYHPTVAGMLERFTAPEVARVNPNLGPIQRALLDLNEVLIELKHTKDSETRRLTAALQTARQRLTASDGVLADAPEDEEEIAGPRAELSSLCLVLQGVIERRAPVIAATPEPELEQDPKLLKQAAEEYRAGNRRRNLLIAVVLLLGAGRLVLLSDSRQLAGERTEHHQDRDGVEAVNHLAGATEDQLATGIPSVMEVRLTQLRDGRLKAHAVAFDPNGDPLRLTYRWIENGKVIEIGSSDVLPAEQVASGTEYQVQVSASDGTHESSRVATGVITTATGRKAPPPTATGGKS